MQHYSSARPCKICKKSHARTGREQLSTHLRRPLFIGERVVEGGGRGGHHCRASSPGISLFSLTSNCRHGFKSYSFLGHCRSDLGLGVGGQGVCEQVGGRGTVRLFALLAGLGPPLHPLSLGKSPGGSGLESVLPCHTCHADGERRGQEKLTCLVCLPRSRSSREKRLSLPWEKEGSSRVGNAPGMGSIITKE